MVFQSLNIFKSKSEPVLADDLARLTPQAPQTDEVAVASADSDAQIVQRGTAKPLKDVENPSQGDIEADFAFLNDILSKAGVAETSAPAQPAPRTEAAVQARPQVSSVPKHVPHHKRGAAADKSKPVFAVQEGPRTAAGPAVAAPDVTPAVAEVEVVAVTQAPTVSPADVYSSIVGGEDEAQLALPFEAAVPIAARVEEQAVVEEALADPGPVAPSGTAVASDVAADNEVHCAAEQAAPLDMDQAFDILGLRDNAADDTAPVPTRMDAEIPASEAEIAPTRPSLFARKPKAQKARHPAGLSQHRHYEAGDDGHMPAVTAEPPALVRRLMSVLPAAEIPQGVSEFAKARLAKDPFDRLMEEARHA